MKIILSLSVWNGVFLLKMVVEQKFNPRKLYVKKLYVKLWIWLNKNWLIKKKILETQIMTQHFHNTFTTLLCFTLICKELTFQQLWKYCDDNKIS